MRHPSKTGSRYGILTLTGVAERRGMAIFEQCACDCGAVCFKPRGKLTRGLVTHCGCRTLENKRANSTKHGLSLDPTWRIWWGMRNRCRSPKIKAWHNYGGRGISVCKEWAEFPQFLADMGPRLPGMTLDRIDNDGNYEPGNCRWATYVEQGSNKRTNYRIERNGITKTLNEWALETGMQRQTIRARIKMGWSVEAAFSPILTTKQVSERALAVRYGRKSPAQISQALEKLR